jgi:hypothetical protein
MGTLLALYLLEGLVRATVMATAMAKATILESEISAKGAIAFKELAIYGASLATGSGNEVSANSATMDEVDFGDNPLEVQVLPK